MNPIRLPGDRLLGKPKNWNEERDGKCGQLPVLIDNGCFISVWKPTDEERLRIATGANIALSIVGGQPPVNLFLANVDGETVIINPED